jgi:hypothetical protein
MTSPTRQIPWLRIFVEGLVIVVSILLAFGIDAWWDMHGERLRERQALGALHGDFLEAQREFQLGANAYDRRLASLEVLGGVATGNVRPPSPDSIQVLLQWLVFFATADPPVATLEALEGAGEFSLIRSSRLRTLLSLWQRQYADAKETQLLAYETLIDDVWGWFRPGPPMPNLFNMLPPDLTTSPDPGEVLPYLTTTEFSNLVIQQYLLTSLTSADLDNLLTTTSEIIEELEEALGDSR